MNLDMSDDFINNENIPLENSDLDSPFSATDYKQPVKKVLGESLGKNMLAATPTGVKSVDKKGVSTILCKINMSRYIRKTLEIFKKSHGKL